MYYHSAVGEGGFCPNYVLKLSRDEDLTISKAY